MSWSMLNKYSVGKDHMINLFNDRAPAILAKTHASKIVACSYACDGNVNFRTYDKCYVKGCPCTKSGAKDWCGHGVHGDPQRPCAFKWSQTKYMMNAFKDVHFGKSPLLKSQACGHAETVHNEVIMDPKKWNTGIKDYLWAFVLIDSCTGDCEKSVRRLHKSYTAKHGYTPILYLNRHNTDHPFS